LLLRRVIYFLVAAGLLAALILAFLPSPVEVDGAAVRRGAMLLTVDEEGEARAHDRFVVASPVAGRLERVDLHDGDPVSANQVVALVYPLPLDPRERAELAGRVLAAEAAKREADARAAHALADHEQLRRSRDRAELLGRSGLISREQLEIAQNSEMTARNDLDAARFAAQEAAFQVKVARAGLLAIESTAPDRVVRLKSPVRGRVLRIFEKSEHVVTAGTPVLEVGDPRKLEVVVDVLSTDAVKIKAGSPVLLEDWGGDGTLRAVVRTVEPSAFTKVSALGIDEQRVNIIADFVDDPGRLGNGYRVEARIVTWEGPDVLIVPTSALFRRGEGWSVFVEKGGLAERRTVEVGHRNAFDAEVLGGLDAGDWVVLHPTDRVEDGVRVLVREIQSKHAQE
jgi:HlyD family secretion protein